jgi:hypothetical protein
MEKVMMTKLFAAAATLLFSASALAQAPEPVATLSEIKGRVLVNQGDEFVPATKNMALRPGDRIMVPDNGEAEITFKDECQSDVNENKIFTVPDRSTCAGGTPVVQELAPTGGNAIGAAGGATGTGNGGVAAMVAIVAAIDIWWLNEDDHDVVSP